MIFCLNSCVKEVEINLDKDADVPVMNALVSPENDIRLRLSTTSFILEDLKPVLSEAEVLLYENTFLKDTLIYSDGYFISDYPLEADNIYKVTANIPDYPLVEAIDTMPKLPQVELVDFIENAYQNEEGNTMGQVILNIQDEVEKANYYEIVVIRKYHKEIYNNEVGTSETTYIEEPLYFDNVLNDPVFFNEDLSQYVPESMVFSDNLFEDSQYTLKANFWNQRYGDEEDMTYSIFFRSVSKNYYEYRKTLIKHRDFQEGGFWELEIAPVEMFSNVENGLGIFACFQEVKFDFP